MPPKRYPAPTKKTEPLSSIAGEFRVFADGLEFKFDPVLLTIWQKFVLYVVPKLRKKVPRFDTYNIRMVLAAIFIVVYQKINEQYPEYTRGISDAYPDLDDVLYDFYIVTGAVTKDYRMIKGETLEIIDSNLQSFINIVKSAIKGPSPGRKRKDLSPKKEGKKGPSPKKEGKKGPSPKKSDAIDIVELVDALKKLGKDEEKKEDDTEAIEEEFHHFVDKLYPSEYRNVFVQTVYKAQDTIMELFNLIPEANSYDKKMILSASFVVAWNRVLEIGAKTLFVTPKRDTLAPFWQNSEASSKISVYITLETLLLGIVRKNKKMITAVVTEYIDDEGLGDLYNSPKKPERKVKMERKEKKDIEPGVKLIGQGTYGCVYRKPLQCKNPAMNKKYGSPDYLMKVSDVKALAEEMKISEMMKKIDPFQEYFLYLLPEGCDIKTSYASLRPKCKIEVLEEIREDSKNVKGYFLKYGGVALKDYLATHRDSITIDTVWNWLNKLVKGLVLLKLLGLVHQDLKTDNLVVNAEGDIFFIDFGLTYKASATEDNSVGVFYQILPMFYSLFYADKAERKEKCDDIYGHLTDYKEMYTKLDRLASTDPRRYWQDVIFPNIYKIDIFSIGKIFVDIYTNMKEKFRSQNAGKTDLLRNLILPMYYADPDVQYSLDDIVAYIERNEAKLELKELPITIAKTEKDKRRALRTLCKVGDVEAPASDVIVYKDKKSMLYYCFSEEEMSTLVPYYKNPKLRDGEIDAIFGDTMRELY